MFFTLWMVGIPLAWFLACVALLDPRASELGRLLATPAALWLFVDLYAVPIYWSARAVKAAGIAGSGGAGNR